MLRAISKTKTFSSSATASIPVGGKKKEGRNEVEQTVAVSTRRESQYGFFFLKFFHSFFLSYELMLNLLPPRMKLYGDGFSDELKTTLCLPC